MNDVEDISKKLDVGDPACLKPEGGEGGKGLPVGSYMPFSHSLCVCIFGNGETACEKLRAKCEELARFAPPEETVDTGRSKGPALQAPISSIIAVSLLGTEETREKIGKPLKRYLRRYILKLYSTPEKEFLSEPKHYVRAVNSALQRGAWHGSDIIEFSDLEEADDGVKTRHIFGSVCDSLDLKDVILASVSRRPLDEDPKFSQHSWSRKAARKSAAIEYHFVKRNHVLGWAQTWEKVGFLEENVVQFRDIFDLTCLTCENFDIPLRTTDFHHAEHDWPPMKMALQWPQASSEDPGGPFSSDEGFFEKKDMRNHVETMLAELPDRDRFAITQQGRNNQDKPIGLPLCRIAVDLEPLPQIADGPVFLVGEGRTPAGHACGVGQLVRELELRQKGGLRHRYSDRVDTFLKIADEDTDDPATQRTLDRKKLRLVDKGGQVKWTGTMTEFKLQKIVVDEDAGERLVDSKASKRRIRRHATVTETASAQELRASSSHDDSHDPSE